MEYLNSQSLKQTVAGQAKKMFLPRMDLQHLLRSVERFADGIFRKVWIVHSPLHPPPPVSAKINTVTHDSFIPSEFLPTFCSFSIECFLDRIEGLSDNFVYCNDDYFFLRGVERADFLEGSKPRQFLSRRLSKVDTMEELSTLPLWERALVRSNVLLNRQFLSHVPCPFSIERRCNRHCASVFTRKMFEETWKLFPSELEALARCRCRRVAHERDVVLEVASMLVPWVGVELGLARPAIKPDHFMSYSKGGSDCPEYLRARELFPDPCSYELESSK